MIWSLLFTLSSAQASMVYTPPHLERASARIVVAIHGCLQSSEEMAHGSGWNQLADKHNLVVFYPQLPPGSHVADCWSWYNPANQDARSGQLRSIRDELQYWKRQLHLEQAPVFVTGISAGATMAAGLLACFPDEFTAGSLHSGPAYATATNGMQALMVQKFGPVLGRKTARPCDPRRFQGSVMVIHGTADPVVNPTHADQHIHDFLGHTTSQTTRNHQNGLNYKVTDHEADGRWRGRVVLVQGLAHAWSGFDLNLRHPRLQGSQGLTMTAVPFFSDKGPSATDLTFQFFEDAESQAARLAPRFKLRAY